MPTFECKNIILSVRQLLCASFKVSEIFPMFLGADHSYLPWESDTL